MGDGDLTSVSEVIEQLHRDELPADEDSLQRLRDHDLIPKPKSMGRKGHGYRSVQIEHIRKVLLIQKDLGKKWTYEELAFWMAAWKLHNVPPPLVAEHVKRGTLSYLNGLGRLADRSPTGRRSDDGPPARRMARFSISQLLHATNAQLTDEQATIMQDMTEFIINLFYFRIPPSALSGDLRRIIYMAYPESVADSEFISWQEWLTDNAAIFSRKPGANLVESQIRKALNKEPKILLRSAHDALRGILALKKGLDPVPMPSGDVSKTNQYLYSRIARNKVPALAGISVDLQLKDSQNPWLLRLRRGEDLGFSAFVAQAMNKASES